MDGVNHGRRQRVGRVPEQRESAKFTRGNVGVFVERFNKKDDSIEDFLYDCIAEDFNVQLEDESHEEVGKVLRAMFEGAGEESRV